jgi:uncharacterized protein with HEPN domain
LRDIVDNIDAIGMFSADLDFTAFTADRKTVYAVVRALEIVSEASRRLPADFKDRLPEIDWPAIAASGNVYRHEYEAVDETLIWHTTRHDLGVLRSVAAAELDRLRIAPPRRDG